MSNILHGARLNKKSLIIYKKPPLFVPENIEQIVICLHAQEELEKCDKNIFNVQKLTIDNFDHAMVYYFNQSPFNDDFLTQYSCENEIDLLSLNFDKVTSFVQHTKFMIMFSYTAFKKLISWTTPIIIGMIMPEPPRLRYFHIMQDLYPVEEFFDTKKRFLECIEQYIPILGNRSIKVDILKDDRHGFGLKSRPNIILNTEELLDEIINLSNKTSGHKIKSATKIN